MIARNIGRAAPDNVVAEFDNASTRVSPGVKAKPAALRARREAGLSWTVKLTVAVLLGLLSWAALGLLVFALMN